MDEPRNVPRVGFFCRLCREVYEDHSEHNDDRHAHHADFDATAIMQVVAIDGEYFALDASACNPGTHEFHPHGDHDECLVCGAIKFDTNPMDNDD